MKITLPNNGFGAAVMLLLIALIGIVPFVTVLWVALKFAPWWVAFPVSTVASLLALLFTVKYRP